MPRGQPQLRITPSPRPRPRLVHVEQVGLGEPSRGRRVVPDKDGGCPSAPQDWCRERLTWLKPPRTATVSDISWVLQHSRTTRDAHAVEDSTIALGTRLLLSPPAACRASEEHCAMGTGVARAVPQPPARGDPLQPPGANSLPCSFSPGVSAEPARPSGRPGKQSRRRPPQPKTGRKQGGNGSGSPPQPCPPLPGRTGAAGSFSFPPAAPGLGVCHRAPPRPAASPPLCKAFSGNGPASPPSCSH